MKNIVLKITVVFICTLFIVACSNNPKKPNENTVQPINSQLKTPTKNILLTEGDINKKYTILGQVEYTPEDGKSIYSNQAEAMRQTKETLKKVAYTKYGDKVDAIINARVQQNMRGGFWGAVGAAYGAHSVAFQAEGLAVAFQEENNNAVKPQDTQNTEDVPVTKKRKSKSKK